MQFFMETIVLITVYTVSLYHLMSLLPMAVMNLKDLEIFKSLQRLVFEGKLHTYHKLWLLGAYAYNLQSRN